jgi:hypothetical protein
MAGVGDLDLPSFTEQFKIEYFTSYYFSWEKKKKIRKIYGKSARMSALTKLF